MKIGVCIVSRGAPENLEAVIRGMKFLASSNNDIRYIIGFDDDDVATGVRMQQAFSADPSVILSMGERPVFVGSVWNRCVRAWDAEGYIFSGDDSLCITQWWDLYVESIIKRQMVASAFCAFNPNSVVFPVFRRKWFETIGYIFPEHFPYWFNDTWWHELYEFVYGNSLPVYRELSFGGKIGNTRSMRELDFWWGFFNATRNVRIAEAETIRQKLKIPSNANVFIDKWDNRDRDMRPRIPGFEGLNPITYDPPPQYKIAKEAALKYLEDHNLELWQRL